MGYTLKNIIQEYLIEIGDTQFNKYARFYQLGVSAIRELNMNASGIIKSINMPIKVNSTCDLPLDYLEYRKIGVLASDGCLIALGENNCATFLQPFDDCGQPRKVVLSANNTPTSSIGGLGLVSDNYPNNYRNGEFMGRMFGVSGGLNGYGDYRIDRENQLILISTSNPLTNSIAMEYVADISLSDGDFDVHPYIIESVKAYIYWKAIQRDRGRSIGEKEQAKFDYNTAARWAQRRFTSSTVKEWQAGFRSGSSASAHF